MRQEPAPPSHFSTCPGPLPPQLFDHLDWPLAVDELKQAEKYLHDGGANKVHAACRRGGPAMLRQVGRGLGCQAQLLAQCSGERRRLAGHGVRDYILRSRQRQGHSEGTQGRAARHAPCSTCAHCGCPTVPARPGCRSEPSVSAWAELSRWPSRSTAPSTAPWAFTVCPRRRCARRRTSRWVAECRAATHPPALSSHSSGAALLSRPKPIR